MLSSAIFTDHSTLKLVDVGASFTAAPVSASIEIQNGTNGKITITSIKGSDVGNATTVVLTQSTNAASVAITGTAISIDLHKDGTNSFSDTTASNVKTLMEANSNISALVTVATNTAGIMATAAVASLAGGDDKIVVKGSASASGGVSLASMLRTGKGQFTLTLQEPLINTYGQFIEVSGTSASPTTDVVAKVVVVPDATDKEVFKITLIDYAGAAVDISAASTFRGFIVGQTVGAGIPGSGV